MIQWKIEPQFTLKSHLTRDTMSPLFRIISIIFTFLISATFTANSGENLLIDKCINTRVNVSLPFKIYQFVPTYVTNPEWINRLSRTIYTIKTDVGDRVTVKRHTMMQNGCWQYDSMTTTRKDTTRSQKWFEVHEELCRTPREGPTFKLSYFYLSNDVMMGILTECTEEFRTQVAVVNYKMWSYKSKNWLPDIYGLMRYYNDTDSEELMVNKVPLTDIHHEFFGREDLIECDPKCVGIWSAEAKWRSYRATFVCFVVLIVAIVAMVFCAWVTSM